MVLSQDSETRRGQLVSEVAVQSVCFSDHQLVTCRLGLPPPPSPVTKTIYQALRRIDKEAFRQDILRSDLFGSLQSDSDEYADLFDAEVTRTLDIHAPLRTAHRRNSGQHDMHVLSDEAQQAKQLRCRLERQCCRTGLQSDKQAYNAAFKATRDSIMKSCADHIRSQLQEVSDDIRATWRTAKNLLHSTQRVVHDDMECAELVNKFSDFANKVQRFRLGGPTAVNPPTVCHQTAHRTAVVGF